MEKTLHVSTNILQNNPPHVYILVVLLHFIPLPLQKEKNKIRYSMLTYCIIKQKIIISWTFYDCIFTFFLHKKVFLNISIPFIFVLPFLREKIDADDIYSY